MAILKDTEREQLRQLVKACLLEISKLKVELKNCQKESKNSIKLEKRHVNEKDEKINELQTLLNEKESEIKKLNSIVKEMDVQFEKSKKIQLYFEALTARPKKDLTSFQSQVYQLLSMDKLTVEDHYNRIIDIGFTELSLANFNSILRNLERKGYFKSSREDGTVFWEKIEK